MDFEVPLNRLKFGQEDGAGINARVTGRQDGIEELAANIHARGQIENLVVKACGDDFYSVSNGNRRLAAFHMIYGPDSTEPIRCTLRDVDEDGAFEDSLTTAVTAKQLHPVDQYEAFARLRDKGGKSIEEIARDYGMTKREVEQALALGALSPAIRAAWRAGELSAETAQAFTLAADHETQDKVLAKLHKQIEESGFGRDEIDVDDVETELRVDPNNVGHLLQFVGTEAYEKHKGKILTRDLFGTRHKVSDEKLLKKLAGEKLESICNSLVKEDGWSFATEKKSVRNYWEYGSTKVEPDPDEQEAARIAELERIIGSDANLLPSDMTDAQRAACDELKTIQRAIIARAFTPALRAKSGCWVEIDDDGSLKIEYGRIKPKEKAAAAVVERTEQKAAVARKAAAEGKPAPESKSLSNALKQRLEMTLVAATRDAIAGEPQLANSPLFDILARVICSQIVADRAWGTPDAIRTKLPSIRQVLNGGVFNTALAKHFDAENYFSSAPKGFVIKAIAEAINPDEARKASTGKTKAEIWKFALANLAKTGWLPKELRTVHYAGPGSEGYKRPVMPPATAADTSPPTKPATTSEAVKKAKAEREAKRNSVVMKRAAASKKAVKKTSAKKR